MNHWIHYPIRLLFFLYVVCATPLFAGGFSLRFFGNGTGDIDRVKIPLVGNPDIPANIGSTDITIEFWMKAIPGENGAGSCISGDDGWINGNIILDRDVFGNGDFGDYGISLFADGIAFGVHNGTSGQGICGTTNVADSNWHHIAATRRVSDGLMRIFVDGILEAEEDGPDGNISYNEAHPGPSPNDPFLVIGAEKHDAGPAFPSFSGWIDEVRLSRNIRYVTNFTRPSQAFSSDANTAALYHFDEGTGDLITDSTPGNASNGTRNFGGSPAGPVWSADKAPIGPFTLAFPTFIGSGLVRPVAFTHAGDGSGRIFITQQEGIISLWNGSSLSEFLNITDVVRDSGNEEGLLSVAFHPNYENNGFFFVYYTNNSGNIEIARYSVSESDPDDGDELSGEIIITVNHPVEDNHNGGQLQFGPDGYLYAGTGDGGSAGDPPNNAENINVLLGKMLRLDIDSAFPYDTPSDNPFDGAIPGADEIWAYGLRNPWRFSFDRITNDLFIGDVGQNQWEEVDLEEYATRTGGTHWGWDTMEGTHCHEPSSGCDMSGKKLPILEYSHGVGFSITGGYRYRGFNVPHINGKYVYGDLGGDVFLGSQSGTGSWLPQTVNQSFTISAFGEDENGELYLVDLNGSVRRITESFVNISAAITDSPDPVTTGNNLTYTIVVSNNGSIQASGVTFIDELPAQVSFVSTSHTGCTHTSGVVRCNLGSINAGANVSFQIVVNVNSSGSFNNYGIASANEIDSALTNNADTETTTANDPTGADLSVTKTDSEDPVGTGNDFSYTIDVSNGGPENATGVTVTDTLPSSVSFVSASAGCSHVSGTVTCSIGNLAEGASTSITITVTAVNAGTATNTVSISGAEEDSNPGNNSDSENTTIVDPATCLFCDDFEDGVLSDQWTYVKPTWNETGGALVGTPSARKAEAIASPAFNGCSICTLETTIRSSGGPFGRVWALGWFVDKQTLVELLMKESSDTWILKQRIGRVVVAKQKVKRPIDPGTTYNARISFNGSAFEVFFDGENTPAITMNAVGTPTGTVGVRVKNTTGTFGSITVD